MRTTSRSRKSKRARSGSRGKGRTRRGSESRTEPGSDDSWEWTTASTSESEVERDPVVPSGRPARVAARVFGTATRAVQAARGAAAPPRPLPGGFDHYGFELNVVRSDSRGNRVLCDELSFSFPRWCAVGADAILEDAVLGDSVAANLRRRVGSGDDGGGGAGVAARAKLAIAEAVAEAPMVVVTGWLDDRAAEEFDHLRGCALASVNGHILQGLDAAGVQRALVEEPHPRHVVLRRNLQPYFPSEQWGGAMDFVFGYPGYGNRFATAAFVRAAVRRDAAGMRQAVTDGLQDVNDFTHTGSRALHGAASTASLSALAWLLLHGADVTAVDDSGSTIVHSCCARQRPEVLLALFAALEDSPRGADARVSPPEVASPTAQLGAMTRSVGELLAAQHAALAQEAFPLPGARQSGDGEATEEDDEDEVEDSVESDSRLSGAAVETKAEEDGEGEREGLGSRPGAGPAPGGSGDDAAGNDSSAHAPCHAGPVAERGAVEEDGEGEEETGHLTALPIDFVAPPAAHARARTAPSGERRLAPQDAAPDRREYGRRPGTQGAGKAGQRGGELAASEGDPHDDPLASLHPASRGQDRDGLLSVSQSRLLAFSRPHTQSGVEPGPGAGDLLAWGRDEVEDLGLVEHPEELSEWWSEGEEPSPRSAASSLLSEEGGAGGSEDSGAEPEGRWTEPAAGAKGAQEAGSRPHTGTASPPSGGSVASASSSGSPTRAPTRRRRRTRGGEAASRRAEESAHLVPRLHGPESDWLLYADALPLPPVASQSVLPLLLKPLRTGATVLHILARAPPDLAPAWLGGLHSVDLHPRRHGTAAGFRPRKRPQWVLHEVPELLLVLAVTGAAAAKATLSPAATHITLPSAQQAEADAGEAIPDALLLSLLEDDRRRRKGRSAPSGGKDQAGLETIAEGRAAEVGAAAAPRSGAQQAAAEEEMRRHSVRACAFYAARHEAAALLYAARSMRCVVGALREADRASLAAWLATEDAQGWTCLHWAARSARLRMVQALLALGADPDQLGTGGRTPLAQLLHTQGDEAASTFLHNLRLDEAVAGSHVEAPPPSASTADGEDPVMQAALGEASRSRTQSGREKAWRAVGRRASHVLRYPVAHPLGALFAVSEARGRQAAARALWLAMASTPAHRVFRQPAPASEAARHELETVPVQEIRPLPLHAVEEDHEDGDAAGAGDEGWERGTQGWLWLGDLDAVQRPWLQRHGVDTVVTILESAVTASTHPLGWLPAPEVLPPPRSTGDPVWRVSASEGGGGGSRVRHVAIDCRGAGRAQAWPVLQRVILPLMRVLREALRGGHSVLLADASQGTGQACALVFAFFQLQCGMGSHEAASLLFTRHVQHALPLVGRSEAAARATMLDEVLRINSPVDQGALDGRRRRARRRGKEVADRVESEMMAEMASREVLLRSPWLHTVAEAPPLLAAGRCGREGSVEAGHAEEEPSSPSAPGGEEEHALTYNGHYWRGTMALKERVDAERLRRSRKHQGALLTV